MAKKEIRKKTIIVIGIVLVSIILLAFLISKQKTLFGYEKVLAEYDITGTSTMCLGKNAEYEVIEKEYDLSQKTFFGSESPIRMFCGVGSGLQYDSNDYSFNLALLRGERMSFLSTNCINPKASPEWVLVIPGKENVFLKQVLEIPVLLKKGDTFSIHACSETTCARPINDVIMTELMLVDTDFSILGFSSSLNEEKSCDERQKRFDLLLYTNKNPTNKVLLKTVIPRTNIVKELHYRIESCPLQEQFVLTTKKFEGVGQACISDFGFKPSYFCKEFPVIIVSPVTKSTSKDTILLASIVSNGCVSLDSNKQYIFTFITDYSEKIVEYQIKVGGLQGRLDEQIRIIDSLQLNLSQNADFISGLETTIKNQLEIIERLSKSQAEKDEMIALMLGTISGQESKINELNSIVRINADIINKMNVSVEEQVRVINSLRVSQAEKETIIADLTFKLKTQEQKIVLMQEVIKQLGNDYDLIKEQVLSFQASLKNSDDRIKLLLVTVDELKLSNSEVSDLLSSYNDKIGEQNLLITKLRAENVNLFGLVAEYRAGLLSEKEIISQLRISNEELRVLVSDYENKLQSNKEFISGLKKEVSDEKEIISGLRLSLQEQEDLVSELKKQKSLLIIDFKYFVLGTISVLLVFGIILLWKKKRK